MRLVAALGGNALLQRGEQPAATVQRHHVEDAVAQLAHVAHDNELIVTHGNGPQVGLLAVESANDAALAQPYPLDVIGAQTQGMIGYWLLQAFANALPDRPVVALVTQTVVDIADPAFAHPAKFVGLGYEKKEARRLALASHWSIAPDGPLWRRVVASPEPHRHRGVGHDSLSRRRRESSSSAPVGAGYRCNAGTRTGRLSGVEAVIDKDLAHSAVIARERLSPTCS